MERCFIPKTKAVRNCELMEEKKIGPSLNLLSMFGKVWTVSDKPITTGPRAV